MTRVGKLQFTLAAVIAIPLLIVVGWLWGPNIANGMVVFWLSNAALMTPLSIGVVIAVIGWFFLSEAGRVMSIVAAIALAITSLVMASLVAPYQTAKKYYESSTTTSSDTVTPSFAERAPAEVAALTSNKALMDITGDSVLTKSLADVGEHGHWNTLVIERGWFKGYEVVQNLDVPLFGTAQNKDVQFCEFAETATLRDGGTVPSNNLARSIFTKVPLNVSYASEDIYAYCNDADEPVVVVPLQQISGFMFTTCRPYGVATYNGKTGELNVLRDADEINELPGPVYPLSLARQQRESLVANGTWWEMYVEQVSGFVAATENPEVNLRRMDSDDTDFVTPLMPRGSSASIIATSNVPATTMTPGEYNTLVVSKAPSENVRPGNSTLVDDLKTRYSYMPDMANDTIHVFEITAGKNGGWVVSLGREQSVNYRAYVSPSGNEVELYDRNGNLIAQGSSSNKSDDGSGETASEGVEWTGSNVSGLSNEELTELGHAVMDELAKRSK